VVTLPESAAGLSVANFRGEPHDPARITVAVIHWLTMITVFGVLALTFVDAQMSASDDVNSACRAGDRA